MKSFLHKVKNPQTTSRPKADLLRAQFPSGNSLAPNVGPKVIFISLLSF